MKRAPEVKPSVRCSVEPGAGAGAVSITKRAKLEEPEAADGFTRRSSKLVAADGSDIAMKRARKPEKPSKKEKGAGETSKRSKKRAEEKNKQPNKVEVVHDSSMEEKIMAKLAQLDKKRAEEKPNKMLMRIEKIASKVEKQVGGMKKKKVVTWRLSQELLDYLRTKEVMGLLATEAPLLPWANKMAVALFESDQRFKEETAAEFQENREFDAHVLYQYRTYGYAEIKEEVSDEEDAVEADEEP